MIRLLAAVTRVDRVVVVRVPRLTGHEDLHEPHAALDEAPGHQAARAVGLGRRVVEAVEPVRFRRLAADVQGVGGGELHSGGQLEAGDAGVEFQLVGVAFLVLGVEFAQQLEPALLDGRRPRRPGLEVQDGHAFRAERRALVNRRQPAARPVADAIHRQAARVGQHNIGRQVLIDRTESIGRPRPNARPAGDGQAGVHQPQRLFVVAVLREHRADDGDLVGMGGDVRQRLGKLKAGLAVLMKLVRRLEQVARYLLIVGDLAFRASAWGRAGRRDLGRRA